MKKSLLFFSTAALLVGALSNGAPYVFAQASKQGMNSVDLAAPPKPYKGWEWKHSFRASVCWSGPRAAQVPAQLFVPPGNKLFHGPEFLQNLKGKDVYNRNLMDYLLIHQEEIPQAWEDRTKGCRSRVSFRERSTPGMENS